MKSYKKIKDIESEFNKVVKAIGGDLVKNRLPESPDFENADYIFDNECIIVELKILEKDPASDNELQKKIQALFNKWMEQGEIAAFGHARVESKSLPIEKQLELLRLHSEPVKRVIKKANRQIRDTKEYFKLPQAQGLVLIVNDGNFTLEPEHLAFAAHQSLARDFSNINAVSLVTANLNTAAVNLPTNFKLWMNYRRKNFDISNDFLSRFTNAWFNHYSDITGEPISMIRGQISDISSLKYKIE